MCSSSVTRGDFEQFIAHDVVAYINAHFRTIPKRTSRGLVGHSMGGYGASRIGMKHSDVFGSLYIMSPCCMSAGAVTTDRSQPTSADFTAPASYAMAGGRVWQPRLLMATPPITDLPDSAD